MSNILHLQQRSLTTPMLFSALGEELQGELRREAHTRHYAEGSIIQQRGEEARGFWLIESGSVAVGQFLLDGEFRAAALLGAGDSWGELAMFANRPRVVDALARAPSDVAFIRADRFEALLAREPQVMRDLLGTLSAQLQEMLDLVAGIRKGTAKPRIAGLLANFAGTGDPPRDVAITQQELGELLGLSRATINAGLRELESDGCLMRTYGKIIVIDPAMLRLFALAD